jgi:type II restriction enzyme
VSGDPPWAGLGFEEALTPFESASQNARIWTEGWVAKSLFCPSCGADRLWKYPNNHPVADFLCEACNEEYELKSQKNRIGRKVVDGAYDSMQARLTASNNPHLLLLSYDPKFLGVTDLFVVPKHFFIPEIIQKRKPLAPTARRAGWVGCNILLDQVPQSGKIFLVRDRALVPKADVLESWRRTAFLREEKGEARGWLIEVMKCVEAIGRPEFRLDEVYAYEAKLASIYPDNNNVRPKIRQQLQVLRDHGYLEFIGRGEYRLCVG